VSDERYYTFEFRDAGGSTVPVAHRLRRLLKLALRQLHLRCTDARQTHAEGLLSPLPPAGENPAPEGRA
jgi:hypothetical protein